MIQFVCVDRDWEDVPDDRYDEVIQAYDEWQALGENDEHYPTLPVLRGEEVVDEIDTTLICEIGGGRTKIATIEEHRY